MVVMQLNNKVLTAGQSVRAALFKLVAAVARAEGIAVQFNWRNVCHNAVDIIPGVFKHKS